MYLFIFPWGKIVIGKKGYSLRHGHAGIVCRDGIQGNGQQALVFRTYNQDT